MWVWSFLFAKTSQFPSIRHSYCGSVSFCVRVRFRVDGQNDVTTTRVQIIFSVPGDNWKRFYMRAMIRTWQSTPWGALQVRSHSHEKHILLSSCPPVCLHACPSIRTHQRHSQLADFLEDLYWGLLRTSIENNQIWLKSCTLQEDLSTFYCCWRHSVAIKAFSLLEMVLGC
jgi:hypothetical protein